MPKSLFGLSTNWISYFLGFFTGIAFTWFVRLLKQLASKLRDVVEEQRTKSIENKFLRVEYDYRNATYQYVQSLHLCSFLFPLKSILVEPRLLIPPPQTQPGDILFSRDITSIVIPYMPDYPEMAVQFGAQTITLAQVFGHDKYTKVAIIGHAGSGKTTTLAHFASILCENNHQFDDLSGTIPILVHIAEIDPDDTGDPISNLIKSVLSTLPTSSNSADLETFLRRNFEQEKVIILLDGLDELSISEMDRAVSFLASLMKQMPSVRIATTASIEYFDGLRGLGFVFLSMACWDRTQKTTFLRQWSRNLKEIHPEIREDTLNNETLLLERWLEQSCEYADPLTMTLKALAVYTGGTTGQRRCEAVESYLRRIIQPTARPPLEKLAKQQLLTQTSLITSEYIKDASPELLDMLLDLIKVGLLIQHTTQRVRFVHPTIQGYLAACAMGESDDNDALCQQPNWSAKFEAFSSYVSIKEASRVVQRLLSSNLDPLHRNLISIGRWLRDVSDESRWRINVQRQLVKLMQDNNNALALRTRALTAMILSEREMVKPLLYNFSKSDDSDLLYLACLGFGMIKDPQSVEVLKGFLSNPNLVVMRAACLSLVAIGNRNALESVALLLLHGNNEMRKAAAEALANHIEEGHPTLRDGCTIDDPLTRWAVIFGLMRIGQPWIKQILENLQIHDGEWVVRNAAEQALEELSRPMIHWIDTSIPLSETPWLIEFASEKGIGISPGKSALDLLHLALMEGTDEQRLGALHQLQHKGDKNSVNYILKTLNEKQGELREVAFQVLWHLVRSGIVIP